MNKPYIVGIGGVAGAGKDTLFANLKRRLYLEYGYNVERVAFADSLKEQIRDDILKKYDIDILNCSASDKDSVRSEMVEFAEKKRIETNGQYFINLVEQKILKSNSDIVIITDLRHNYYPNDELYYIKYYRGGFTIHLSKYKIKSSLDGVKYIQYTLPANETESFHDPLVKRDCDLSVQWEHGSDKEYLIQYLSEEIKKRKI